MSGIKVSSLRAARDLDPNHPAAFYELLDELADGVRAPELSAERLVEKLDSLYQRLVQGNLSENRAKLQQVLGVIDYIVLSDGVTDELREAIWWELEEIGTDYAAGVGNVFTLFVPYSGQPWHEYLPCVQQTAQWLMWRLAQSSAEVTDSQLRRFGLTVAENLQIILAARSGQTDLWFDDSGHGSESMIPYALHRAGIAMKNLSFTGMIYSGHIEICLEVAEWLVLARVYVEKQEVLVEELWRLKLKMS